MGIKEQIAQAEERLKQLKALKQKKDARERAAAAKRERANDTRRKILAGAFVLEQLQKNGIGAALFTCEGRRFSDWLTRADDRTLFNLPTDDNASA